MIYVQMVAVKLGIGVFAYPVAQYNELTAVGQVVMLVDVAMADDEVVCLGIVLSILAGKGQCVVLFLAQDDAFAAFVLEAAVASPAVAEIHSPAGVECGKHPLANFIVKDGA